MSTVTANSDLLAQWAAEELWDWRVRALFAAVCVLAALAAIAMYFICGRNRDNERRDGKARRFTSRISIALLVIAVAEASYFKEPVATVLLLVTGAAIGILALGLPPTANPQAEEPPAQSDTPPGTPPSELV